MRREYPKFARGFHAKVPHLGAMPFFIDKISKRFGNSWVLRDVTFEVAPGEVVGIFGPAGSGKSVLLRIAAGLEPSNGGEVRNDLGSQTVLCPPAEGAGLLSLFRKSPRVEASGHAARSLLDDAVSEARGLLLLDNVFASMDDRMREEMIAELRRETKAKGLSVVLATPRFNDVLLACDRVVVLNGTEVRQIGTPREIYEEPESVDVAALVGRANLIEARRISSTKIEAPEFQTIVGDHRVFARKTDKNALGAINQNVYLAIRPEQIAISFGASFPEDNLLRARISGIRFNGSTTSLELDANGLRIEGLVPRLVGLNIGDECMVGLPPDRIKVLKR